MISLLLLLIILPAISYAEPKVIIYEDPLPLPGLPRNKIMYMEETIDAKDKQIIVQYHLSQNSVIENKQSNRIVQPIIEPATPAPTPPAQIEPPAKPSFFERLQEECFSFLRNPASICAAIGAAYIAYCIKTKLSLYTLGKEYITNAVWSLWKSPYTQDDLSDEDREAALFLQIMQHYRTDTYTSAVARFLLDVEKEAALITDYLTAAHQAQGSLTALFCSNLDRTVLEARERLGHLTRLKDIVLHWLGKE